MMRLFPLLLLSSVRSSDKGGKVTKVTDQGRPRISAAWLPSGMAIVEKLENENNSKNAALIV